MPKYFKDYTYSNFDSCYKVSNIPETYAEALENEHSEKWKKAMESEMKSLIENKTFTVMPLPKDKKAIGSRWVFSLKVDPDGKEIYKARFVAKGYAQIQGADYLDTFSPTAKMTSIRMIMQFSAEYNLLVHQLDVKTAYLNAPIDCEVYMQQPEGYIESGVDEVLVWKLNKSLYGLKQSGRNWNIVLNEFFGKNGFSQSAVDACLYFQRDESNIAFIIIWVDDIVVAANSIKLMDNIKNMLKKEFKMKDLGPISWFLGIQFRQTNSGIEMNQSFYLKGILERFNMSDCKPRSTPCELKIDAYDPGTDDIVDSSNDRRYREIVGSLVYAMTCTRPDLAWIVTKLSQHLGKPNKLIG